MVLLLLRSTSLLCVQYLEGTFKRDLLKCVLLRDLLTCVLKVRVATRMCVYTRLQCVLDSLIGKKHKDPNRICGSASSFVRHMFLHHIHHTYHHVAIYMV